MREPFISVIVPVYNVAPYLRRCLDSLLAQTFHNFELILVDDGSSDGSAAICDDYASHSASLHSEEANGVAGIRVIHQENAGVSAARNQGISEARGDYLSFVDADDWVEPGYLQTFADEVKRHGNIDLVIQAFFDRDEKVIAASPCICNTREEIDSILYDLEEQRQIGYVWNKLFRRQLIIGAQLLFDTSLPIGEDAIFCLAFVLQCSSLSLTDSAGYHYNIPALTREYPYQPFAAWERRLDFFETLAQRHKDRSVIQQFRARDFQVALFVLGIAYHVRLGRHLRIPFIHKIRERGRQCRHLLRSQQGVSTMALSWLVIYAPPFLTDIILSCRQHIKTLL